MLNRIQLTVMLMLSVAVLFVTGVALAAAPLSLNEVARPGRVLMLRHAIAPGIGDPPEFRLGDCATQRNLDASGRAQAAKLGQQLARAGVRQARIYSSQWCRTLETARLLGLGTVNELPALNSFFVRAVDRDANVAAVRAFIARLPADGPPVILVTHQVTITAVTGEYVESGDGALLQLNGTDKPRLLGSIKPD